MDKGYEEVRERRTSAIVLFLLAMILSVVGSIVLSNNGIPYGYALPIVSAIFFGLNVMIKCQEVSEYEEDVTESKEVIQANQEKAIRDKYNELCRMCGCPDVPFHLLDTLVWIAYDHLYQVESFNSYRRRYPNIITDFSSLPEQNMQYKMIPISNIQYFAKEGDVQYTSQITGGGGGGSSISGAIIGGMIAGEAGAIIGSRKKTNEIKTTTVRHDTRQTIVRYYEGDSINVLTDSGFDFYDYLLTQIPDKDLLTIQLKQSSLMQVSDNDIKAKLQQVQDLYTSGLITEQEYAAKRQSLLSSL